MASPRGTAPSWNTVSQGLPGRVTRTLGEASPANPVSNHHMTKRLWLTADSVACIYAFAASSALAQCPSANVGLSSLLEQERVALVFLGTAGPVEHVGAAERVTFAVQRVWKGQGKQATTIYRPIRSATANSEPAIIFERGQRYVVVAHRLAARERTELGVDDVGDLFGVDACGDGTRVLSTAIPELGKLGPASGPIDLDDSLQPGPTITQPQKLSEVPPVVPRGVDPNIRGMVIVELIVDEAGRVSSARVLRSGPWTPQPLAAIPSLDQSAIDCVKQWVFLSGLVNGTPMPMLLTVVVRF